MESIRALLQHKDSKKEGILIYVRDDDVLIHSSDWENPFGRLKQVHDWICRSPRFIHRVNILVHNVLSSGDERGRAGLAAFPEAIEYIAEETRNGRMEPEIHGWEHIDYKKLSVREVRDHLSRCKDFIQDKFNYKPHSWYTPWGANAPHLYEAAHEEELRLVDCSVINKMRGEHGIVQRLKDGHDISFLEDQEIFTHWWEGGARLLRIVEVEIHGSWEAAKKANRGDLFRE